MRIIYFVLAMLAGTVCVSSAQNQADYIVTPESVENIKKTAHTFLHKNRYHSPFKKTAQEYAKNLYTYADRGYLTTERKQNCANQMLDIINSIMTNAPHRNENITAHHKRKYNIPKNIHLHKHVEDLIHLNDIIIKDV